MKDNNLTPEEVARVFEAFSRLPWWRRQFIMWKVNRRQRERHSDYIAPSLVSTVTTWAVFGLIAFWIVWFITTRWA